MFYYAKPRLVGAKHEPIAAADFWRQQPALTRIPHFPALRTPRQQLCSGGTGLARNVNLRVYYRSRGFVDVVEQPRK